MDIHVAANQSSHEATGLRARSPDGAGASRLAATHPGHVAECRRGEHARQHKPVASRGSQMHGSNDRARITSDLSGERRALP